MKKQIMVKAWEIARNGQKKFGGRVSEYIAEALRIAWAEAKAPKKVIIKVRHQPSAGKEWVAEIVGTHPKWKYERVFLKASDRRWSGSGKTGLTTFTLEEGKIYEVNEPWKGRYFATVENGEIVYLNGIQVEERIA